MQKRSTGPCRWRRGVRAVALLMLLVGGMLAAGCISWGKQAKPLGLFPSEEETTLGLELLWTLPLEMDSAVADVYLLPRTLCVVAEDGTLRAIDPEKGHTRWEQYFGGEMPTRGAEDVDHVYVIAGGKLRALEWEFGEEVDSRPLDFVASSQPVVDLTYLYVGSADGRLHAVDLAQPLPWQQTVKSAVRSRPQVDPAGVYFAADNGTVYSVSLMDGTREWEFATDDSIVADLALGTNVLYVASTDGRLYCLDTALGVSRKQQQRWLVPYYAGGPIRQTPVLSGDLVFVTAESGGVHAVNTADGSRAWKCEGTDSFIAAGKKRVYLGSGGRELVCVDRATGEEFWRQRLPGRGKRGLYRFVVNELNDHIYLCRQRDGQLYCYRPR